MHHSICPESKDSIFINGFASGISLDKTFGSGTLSTPCKTFSDCPRDFFSMEKLPAPVTTPRTKTMKTLKAFPEARGTRTGYVIRYTCPTCIAENIIVSNSPRDHFKAERTVSCRNCRARVTVQTPN